MDTQALLGRLGSIINIRKMYTVEELRKRVEAKMGIKKVATHLCACGCGIEIPVTNTYVCGHVARVNNPMKKFATRNKVAQEIVELWKNDDYRSRVIAGNSVPRGKRKSPFPLAGRQAMSRAARKRCQDPSELERLERISGIGESGYFFSRKNNNNIFWRCSYEPIALKILEKDPDVVEFKRCSFRIPYVLNGQEHSYWPDFLVTYIGGTKKVIEIKAQWEIDNAEVGKWIEAKKQAAILFLDKLGIKYEIWTESVLFD